MKEKDKTTISDNKTILVVEDDPDMNVMSRDILRSAGYETIAAYNGTEALNYLEKATPDLILLDFMLPDIPGDEVCRRISENEEKKHIPIIIVSARRDLPTRLSSFLFGAKRYISKPFSSKDLLEFIRIELKRSEVKTVRERKN